MKRTKEEEKKLRKRLAKIDVSDSKVPGIDFKFNYRYDTDLDVLNFVADSFIEAYDRKPRSYIEFINLYYLFEQAKVLLAMRPTIYQDKPSFILPGLHRVGTYGPDTYFIALNNRIHQIFLREPAKSFGGRDKKMGYILGFPECSIEAYTKIKRENCLELKLIDLKRMPEGDAIWYHPRMQGYMYGYTGYIPCNRKCHAGIEDYKNSREVWEMMFGKKMMMPKVARKFGFRKVTPINLKKVTTKMLKQARLTEEEIEGCGE